MHTHYYTFICCDKKVLRQMPFLLQPSSFIWALDLYQKTLEYAFNGWFAQCCGSYKGIKLMSHTMKI